MASERRLIDVTEPLKLFRGWLKQLELPEDAGDKRGVESCIDILEDEPAVDAVEVVHGKWSTIEDDYLGLTALACSECKQEYWFEEEPPLKIYSYCPNCGAKMDGK